MKKHDVIIPGIAVRDHPVGVVIAFGLEQILHRALYSTIAVIAQEVAGAFHLSRTRAHGLEAEEGELDAVLEVRADRHVLVRGEDVFAEWRDELAEKFGVAEFQAQRGCVQRCQRLWDV